MFDKPYDYHFINKVETGLPDPISKEFYRFKAKRRTYFVTLELYSFGITAIKYCDIKNKNSRRAYEKIFNDGDAFRVITTCIKIMWDYRKKNPKTSFAFYAVPRFAPKKETRVRLNIYRYGMINIFKKNEFDHYQDVDNAIYLMLHNSMSMVSQDEIIRKLEEYLLSHHDIIFTPIPH
jgi:hypothetical protein